MSIKIRAIEPPIKTQADRGNVYWTHTVVVGKEVYALLADYEDDPILVWPAVYLDAKEEFGPVPDHIVVKLADHIKENQITLWTKQQIEEAHHGEVQ